MPSKYFESGTVPHEIDTPFNLHDHIDELDDAIAEQILNVKDPIRLDELRQIRAQLLAVRTADQLSDFKKRFRVLMPPNFILNEEIAALTPPVREKVETNKQENNSTTTDQLENRIVELKAQLKTGVPAKNKSEFKALNNHAARIHGDIKRIRRTARPEEIALVEEKVDEIIERAERLLPTEWSVGPYDEKNALLHIPAQQPYNLAIPGLGKPKVSSKSDVLFFTYPDTHTSITFAMTDHGIHVKMASRWFSDTHMTPYDAEAMAGMVAALDRFKSQVINHLPPSAPTKESKEILSGKDRKRYIRSLIKKLTEYI